MKFIHTADVHWGMVPDGDQPWSRERARAIRDTFSQIVSLAGKEEADFLFISGDLFHGQPLLKDLKDVNYLFSTVPAVHVVIIAGSRDRIRASSALHGFRWCPNVTYLTDGEMTGVYFEDCNVEVHGFSYHTAEIRNSLTEKELRVPADGRIHILLAYGGDASHLPLDKDSLAASGYSYIALGSSHKPEILVDKKAAYPGSPEPLDQTETGEHGVLKGVIDPGTRKTDSLELIPMSKVRYVPLVVNVTTRTTPEELERRISQVIETRGPENIYRFRIRGMRNPDAEFDLKRLKTRYRILGISDESEPQYDFSALFAEHSSDMIGFYIRAFDKPDMSPVEKKALYYGINALLHTTDERR